MPRKHKTSLFSGIRVVLRFDTTLQIVIASCGLILKSPHTLKTSKSLKGVSLFRGSPTLYYGGIYVIYASYLLLTGSCLLSLSFPPCPLCFCARLLSHCRGKAHSSVDYSYTLDYVTVVRIAHQNM